MTNRKRLLLAGSIAVLLLIAWIGGFVYFVRSENWSDAKMLIAANKQYPVLPGSIIQPRLLNFSYRFSGNYETFQLDVEIESAAEDREFHVEFERRGGALRLIRIVPE